MTLSAYLPISGEADVPAIVHNVSDALLVHRNKCVNQQLRVLSIALGDLTDRRLGILPYFLCLLRNTCPAFLR